MKKDIVRKCMWLAHKYRDDRKTKRLEQFHHVLWYSVHNHVGGWKDYSQLAKLVINDRKSKYKIDKHFKAMQAFPYIYFITLTFYDISCKESTMQQKVSRYLNSITSDYIACKEYGEKNGRIHYHAIVAFENPLETNGHKNQYAMPSEWKWGFYKCEKPRNINKSKNYMLKAYRYATKGEFKPFHKRNVTYPLYSDDELPIM